MLIKSRLKHNNRHRNRCLRNSCFMICTAYLIIIWSILIGMYQIRLHQCTPIIQQILYQFMIVCDRDFII